MKKWASGGITMAAVLVPEMTMAMAIPRCRVKTRMIAATQMANLLGLTPLESAQRMGPVLAGELVRHMTSAWDIGFAALALVLAWRFGR